MLVLFSGENGARDTIRFIEEKAAVGIWFCDLKTRKMEWSDGFFHLLGLEPDSVEPSYALFETMVHPDDVRPTGEIEYLLHRAGPIERRFRLILDNRRVRHLLNRGEVLLDREGKPDKAIGVLADVTELTEALSSFETQRQRLRRLTEAMPAIVFTVNANGEVGDLWNWQNFTGVSANRAAGYGWLDNVHPEEQQAVKQSWTSDIGRGAAFELEFRLRRADGLYRWMQARGRPTTDARGSIIEWLVVCVDIHDQKLWLSSPESLTVTGAQLRAARGIFNWSVRQLADAAGVAVSVVRRLEEVDGPPTTFEAIFPLIKQAIENAGVEFLFPPLGKPGVRPR